jgi:major vault protein
LKKTVDYLGVSREAGENWLVRKTGAYLPRVNEKFIGYIKGLIITENNVLLLEAVSNFKDVYGI